MVPALHRAAFKVVLQGVEVLGLQTGGLILLAFLLLFASVTGHCLCPSKQVVTYSGIGRLVINHNLLKCRTV